MSMPSRLVENLMHISSVYSISSAISFGADTGRPVIYTGENEEENGEIQQILPVAGAEQHPTLCKG